MAWRIHQFILLLGILAVPLTGRGSACLEAKDDLSGAEAATTFAWAKDTFARIDCRAVTEPGQRLRSHDRSILRWSNPSVGRVYGDVFMWTRGNRPAALVSLYQWHSPYTQRSAEFLSLVGEPMTATLGTDVLWRPAPASLRWTPWKPQVVVASAAPARLVQMRSLVSRFQIVLDDRRLDARGERQSLRQLARPVYRYSNRATGLVDGAMFAFVTGTDPEAFLLVEARANATAKATWSYALARMNTDALSVSLDGTVVKRFPNVVKLYQDPRQPYSIAVLPNATAGRASVVREER